MRSLLASAALSALTYASLASAEPVQYCPIDNVCYSVAVPSASASSNSGSIYFQLRAPTSYSWVGLGTGTMMAGSNMFLLYTDGSGNVTISPRTGTGHQPPEPNTDTQLELLAGSGVDGDTMIANVRCDNCNSWNGGSMSLADNAAGWFAAWLEGAGLDSTDADATISKHDAHDQWTFDLTQATIADDANPFVDGSGQATDTPTSDGDTGVGQASVPAWAREIPAIKSAHGIIMSIVMVLLYPLGAALMPVFGRWWIHGAWQGIAFLAMWAGFGLGIVLAERTSINFSSSHTTLGTAVVALFGLQPALGYMHHLTYVKTQRRSAVSHVHIWYGRALMIMGVVNGGLGLALADAGNDLVIAYSVVAAVVFVVYGAAAAWGMVKRSRNSGSRRLGDVGADETGRARKAEREGGSL